MGVGKSFSTSKNMHCICELGSAFLQDSQLDIYKHCTTLKFVSNTDAKSWSNSAGQAAAPEKRNM